MQGSKRNVSTLDDTDKDTDSFENYTTESSNFRTVNAHEDMFISNAQQAVENTGEFLTEDDDIRFRTVNDNTNFAYYENDADRAGAARDENADRRNGPADDRPTAGRLEVVNDRGRIRVLEAGVAPAHHEYRSGLEGIFERREDQEAEAWRIIAAAKENGLFIEPETYSDLPKLHLASRESVVYFDEANNRAIKVKDPFAVEDMTGRRSCRRRH